MEESKRLTFCKLFVEYQFSLKDWQKMGQEILNSSSFPNLLREDVFFPSLLMQISKKTDPESLKKWEKLGDIFYEYFWEELKGNFAEFAEERERIKYILIALINDMNIAKSTSTKKYKNLYSSEIEFRAKVDEYSQNLPELEGTEKQISFAHNIRKQAINHFRLTGDESDFKRFQKVIENQTKAVWWIERKNEIKCLF